MAVDFADVLAADIARRDAQQKAFADKTPAAQKAANEATDAFVDLIDSMSVAEVLSYRTYRKNHM